MKRVEFFFDLSSPYSYLAATQVEKLAARQGAAVEWKPFVLGAVFKSTGNTMPAKVPAKASYMLADLGRWAAHYGVPFRFTSRFPVNALKAMRLILVAEEKSAAAARQVALGAFQALWVGDHDITDNAELGRLAATVDLDPAAALAAIERPEIKDKLRRLTDDAIARGAFGAPAFFVGGELFWGNDRLQFVEEALARS